MRKFFTAVLLIPLGLVFLVFAVANRHFVTVSFDPFNSTDPSIAVTLPLFVVIIAVAILGVAAGGSATWFRQRRWRRLARQHEADARPQFAAVSVGIEAEHPDGAAVRPPIALQDLHGRRLARAIGAQQSKDLARLNGEREAVYDSTAAIVFDQVADFNRRGGCFSHNEAMERGC